MELLPKELVIVILSNCTVRNIINSMTVSKSFCEICKDNQLWKQFMNKPNYRIFTNNGFVDYKINSILKKLSNHASCYYDKSFIESSRLIFHETEVNMTIPKKNIAIPEEIKYLTCLKYVNISDHKIISIPKELGQLYKLEVLSLGCNILTTIPKELGQLKQLKILSLECNNLTTIPKELGQLISLESLELQYNQLTEIPKELGQLKKLLELNLYNNKLTTLPKELCQLTKLRSFTVLNTNPIKTFPKELWQLNCLKNLNKKYSYLPDIPR